MVLQREGLLRVSVSNEMAARFSMPPLRAGTPDAVWITRLPKNIYEGIRCCIKKE